MQTLSMLSMAGVVLMLLVAFRRLGAVVLTMVPLFAGIAVATAVTLASSGQIHALTLAFGTTLVGVCVDYPVHLLTHHVLERERSALDIVWPALVLGAATTVAGFAALAIFGLPGVREMGLFAATGVAAALGATRWLVAPMLGTPRGVAAAHRSAAVLDRGIEWLAQRRASVAMVAVAVLALAIAGWTRAAWIDDTRALGTALPAISEEDARVRARIGGNEIGRVLIAEGATIDDAALVQDRVWAALDADARSRLRSSAPVLWSTQTQDASLAAVRTIPDLAPRTRAALVAAGFRPEPFAALQDAIATDPGPFDHAEIVAAGLDDLVRPFVVQTDGGVALLSFVGDVDRAVLDAAASTAGATFFDQRAFTEDLYREHRRGSLRAVLLGLVVVVLVLAARHRNARRVAIALVPALVAAAAALGIVAWTGVPLQLLHLVAGLLVLSMGVDYGVFLVETEHLPRGRPAAVLGVAIACATTVLAFGVLGTSDNPALAALGTTTALGVALAALGAPVMLAVTKRGAQ
jgi:predicted exporter